MAIAAIASAVISAGATVYSGAKAASAQKSAQQQAAADQARMQKASDARKPDTSAIMAAAQSKAGTSSGTNLTAGAAASQPLGGGASLLGG